MLRSSRVHRLRASTLLMVLGLSACTPDIQDVPIEECASGRKWVGGNQGSPLMHPGQNCKGCHNFAVAGTVYDQEGIHDPNECLGVEGVSVLVEDAAGNAYALETNESGNFYLQRGGLQFPLTLHAERDGEMLMMSMQASTGACASCHSESGANGAAGRIFSP